METSKHMENKLKVAFPQQNNHREYPTRIYCFNKTWDIHDDDYKKNRPYYFHPTIDKFPLEPWAETLNPSCSELDWKNKYSYELKGTLFDRGKFELCTYKTKLGEYTSFLPLNPKGRQGIGGRGLLGKWGPNHAADPIVTCFNPETNDLEILMIERTDTPGIWALPGGMRDKDECLSKTVIRELREETNAILDISDAELVYKGYTADQRNTDHAWLETAAYHFHIDENKRNILVNTIVAADDACKVKLIIADDSNPDYKFMYGGHYDFVNPVVQKLKQKNVVNNSSKGFLSWLFGF